MAAAPAAGFRAVWSRVWPGSCRCDGAGARGRLKHTAAAAAAAIARSEPGLGDEAEQEARRRDLQELLREFPQPKNLLAQIVQRALKSPDIKDHIVYQSSDGVLKKTTLQVHWPKTIQVEGYGSKKIDAERHAAANACKLLKEWGLLGPHNQLFPSQEYTELVDRLGQTAGTVQRELSDEGEDGEGKMDCTDSMSTAQNSHRAGRREGMEANAARALIQFPQPKYLLSKVIQIATSSSSITDCVRYITIGNSVKTCRLELRWPSPMTFSASGRRKSDVERRAAALACQKLKELGYLDQKNRPLTHATYNKTAIKALSMKERLPTRLHIPSDLRQRIQEYLLQYPVDSESESAHRASLGPEAELGLDTDMVVDTITGREYVPLEEQEAERLSQRLEEMWERSRPEQSQLPVDSQREALLSAIEGNRVVVVSGATGCGKTTRVPQFILEHHVRGGRGADCNIVVTQPRRLSAVSVAQRVREELGPALARRVGYQVRLESRLPLCGGALLFCTVGVLLRKLQGNPRLEGLSHVLVDEVHECDVDTDFLLVLLREALVGNPGLRLVLMSATGDTQRLSRYFGDCPIVHVPGFLHPVTEHYLEDILPIIGGSRSTQAEADPTPDLDLVTDTILHIHANGQPGGILCFLPGWQEIRGVQHQLQERLSDPKSCIIHPVHSHIPVSDQRGIFQAPPPGTRKVVLATNVAETSITINDIVYVVDTGCQRQQNYDRTTKVSCLDTVWVSRANVWQRRGRAGRCQPGHVYYLFPRAQLQAMEEFQTPEILRSPLDSVLLQAKLHAPDMAVGDFLSKAMNSPEPAAVSEAVRNLQEIGVLDEREGLTALGLRLSHISSEPRLAKAVVLACVFRCLYPVLSIVACLTREPFLNSLLNRAEVLQAKSRLAGDTRSDHMAYTRAVSGWRRALGHPDPHTKNSFLQEHRLSSASLHFIHGLIQQFSENVFNAFLVPRAADCTHPQSVCNQYSQQHQLITGILLAGLYPNLIQIRRGIVTRDGKFRPNSLAYRSPSGRVLLHRSTINRDENTFPSRWLTYYTAVKSNGNIFVRDSSMVHPLALLLLTHSQVSITVEGERMLWTLDDHGLVRLETDEETGSALEGLRVAVNRMTETCLSHNLPHLPPHLQQQHDQLLPLVVELLNCPLTDLTGSEGGELEERRGGGAGGRRRRSWRSELQEPEE